MRNFRQQIMNILFKFKLLYFKKVDKTFFLIKTCMKHREQKSLYITRFHNQFNFFFSFNGGNFD